MRYKLSLIAEAHLEESIAYNYYEDANPGLGEDFLETLAACYRKITEHPFHYSYLGNSKVLRSAKVHRFPFVIIFLVYENNVTVVSVRNTNRQPYA